MDLSANAAMTLSRLGAIAFFVLATSGAAAQPAPASDTAPNTPPRACGFVLSTPVAAVWNDAGGEGGRLGCPTQQEGPSPTSPQGSAARVAMFGMNGEIILHVAGPRAGQAFSVSGCFYRLHTQFSGTGGWLGLPIADSENTPDGARQAFEGGVMRYARALDDCEATPTAGAVVAARADQTPLDLYQNPATGDWRSLASRTSAEAALAAGYVRRRSQAQVTTSAGADTLPLKLYINEASGLSETLATIQSEREALDAGYTFAGDQGYVWAGPRPGATPLKLFRDGSGRTRLVAGPEDEREAGAASYEFARVEGYAAAP